MTDTASDREEIRDQAEEAGADGIIQKPVNQSILFDALMDAFGDQRERTRTPPLVPKADEFLSGRKILLVEDNAINQQVAVELLESVGASVSVAGNGFAALSLLVHGDEPKAFDLVFMDLQMPEMDGFEATRRIRQDPRISALPIVAMTAHGRAEELEKCLVTGMNDHIIKPINPETLFATIRRLLSDTEQADPSDGPRPAARGTQTFPDVAGLNVEHGLARAMGDGETYRKLLALFRINHADDAKAIGRAVEDGKWDLAEELVHTLKEVSGIIGAEAMFDAATDLESATSERAESDVRRRALARTEKNLLELLAGLETVLAAEGGLSHGAEPVLDPKTLAAGLERLRILLADADAEAVDHWNEIRPELAMTANSADVGKLDMQIQAFEFEAALQTLTDLKATPGAPDTSDSPQ